MLPQESTIHGSDTTRTPLEITTKSTHVQLMVVGELTLTEERTYLKIAQTGLGIGVPSTSQMMGSPHTECKPSTSTDVSSRCSKTIPPLKKRIKVIVRKLGITDIEGRFIVTEQFLSRLPTSKYRPISYLKEITTLPTYRPEGTSTDSDTTIAYSSSDETIICNIGEKDTTQMKPKSCTFSMNVHGIK